MSTIVGTPLTAEELGRVWSVDEIEALARERMVPALWDYIASWAGSGEGIRINREAWAGWRIRPRILRDVAAMDLSTEVLGRRLRTPVLLGASALHRLSHPDGELATARAATAAGSLMMLSTSSSTSIEEVGAVAADRWMQLYWMNDREVTRDIVARAEAAGFHAIALTVDAPRLGWREQEYRRGDWDTGGVDQVILPNPWPPGLAIDPSITWRSLDWLRGITRLPVVLKGVLSAEDAAIAASEGIPGIVVSNHGGRQVDYAIAPIDALPAIADAVAGSVELYLDSGVRRGTDVLKALALGARAVFVGRPVHWGLATGGEAGVARVLELIGAELSNAMGICGAARIADLRPELLVPATR